MADDQQAPNGTARDKDGYVKIEADLPVAAVRGENDSSKKPPPPTTTTVAGYGVDDIIKAPVKPPAPKPGDHGPPVAEKMNQTTYNVSKEIGPRRPGLVNQVLVGFGVFICLLGLTGFAFLSSSAALMILIIGFVITAAGAFLRL